MFTINIFKIYENDKNIKPKISIAENSHFDLKEIVDSFVSYLRDSIPSPNFTRTSSARQAIGITKSFVTKQDFSNSDSVATS